MTTPTTIQTSTRIAGYAVHVDGLVITLVYGENGLETVMYRVGTGVSEKLASADFRVTCFQLRRTHELSATRSRDIEYRDCDVVAFNTIKKSVVPSFPTFGEFVKGLYVLPGSFLWTLLDYRVYVAQVDHTGNIYLTQDACAYTDPSAVYAAMCKRAGVEPDKLVNAWSVLFCESLGNQPLAQARFACWQDRELGITGCQTVDEEMKWHLLDRITPLDSDSSDGSDDGNDEPESSDISVDSSGVLSNQQDLDFIVDLNPSDDLIWPSSFSVKDFHGKLVSRGKMFPLSSEWHTLNEIKANLTE